MTTTTIQPMTTSSWNTTRLAIVTLLIVAAALVAFAVGRVTGGSHSTRTVTVTRVVPASAPISDPCRPAHHGAC